VSTLHRTIASDEAATLLRMVFLRYPLKATRF
jgi:hypothetical protein